MANERYVRFDANRAFYLATVAIALMGGSFAVGLRLGQDMPASFENMFSGPASNDLAAPVLAPEQVVPVETYTFYDSQRELDRQPREQPVAPAEPVVALAEPAAEEEPAAVRVIDREPVRLRQPVEPSAELVVAEAAPPEDEPAAEVQAAAEPGRIERQTVVRSMNEVDGF
ncbi:MAG: hypothetical protein ACJAYU_004831 [Bradymonadia bacterium]|jgi:hypothetical protein